MKHLKLFENFDRYSFGEHTDVVTNSDKMKYVDENSIKFTEDEIQKIKNELPLCKNVDYAEDGNKIEIKFPFTAYADEIYQADYFGIYSLGDYCYAVARYEMEADYENEVDVYTYSRVWLFDDMEELIELVQQINKLGK